MLRAMHQDPQDHAGRRQPAGSRPAVEDHGRGVTANSRAAAFYRQAQRAADSAHALTALRLAVKADSAFGLAMADLEAFTDVHPSPIVGRQMNWERHHIEVVRAAALGNFDRATDLLREHLASVGCDPLAIRIITDLGRRMGKWGGLEDLTDELPRCHPDAQREQ
jgi:DNA-binding GntR family transcriptional regulator